MDYSKTMTKTLQQIKDGVANDNGWSNWDSATPPWVEAREVERLMNEVVIRYAQEQSKGLITALENIENLLEVGASISTESVRRVINKHKGGKS